MTPLSFIREEALLLATTIFEQQQQQLFTTQVDLLLFSTLTFYIIFALFSINITILFCFVKITGSMDDQRRWDEPQQQQQQMILQKEAAAGGNNTTDQSDHHRQSAAGTGDEVNWRKFDVRYSTFVEASEQVNLAKEFEQYGETLQQYERNTLHKPTVTAEREMTTLRTSFGRIQAGVEQLKESESFEAIFASVQAMGEFLRSRPYLTREDLEYHRLVFLETYNRLMVTLVRTTVSCSLMLAIEQVNKLAAFLGEVVQCGSVLGSCRAQFDEVMALVRQAKGYCSQAEQYLEEYHNGVNIGERRRRELAGLIRMQRDLITMTYNQAVEKMGR